MQPHRLQQSSLDPLDSFRLVCSDALNENIAVSGVPSLTTKSPRDSFLDGFLHHDLFSFLPYSMPSQCAIPCGDAASTPIRSVKAGYSSSGTSSRKIVSR